MKRTTEFVLGLIGGIFGILCAFIALFIGGVASAMEAEGASNVIGLGWAAVALSILGIVGSVMVKSKSGRGYDDNRCNWRIYLYFFHLYFTCSFTINRWANGNFS